MSGKFDISFLLNPLSSIDMGSVRIARPITPPPLDTLAQLAGMAQSPSAMATSLLLLGSTITPLEKVVSDSTTALKCKKPQVPALVLTVLCSARDNHSCTSDEEESSSEERPSSVSKKPLFKAATEPMRPMITSLMTSKTTCTRVRKYRMPPCQVEGCTNFAVSRGSCVRHGGGTRCTISGCPNRAKLHNKCFQHGGYKTCATETCTRKAKRYGYCWSHGGGRICKISECKKVSTQGGLCWAHGGGNRCKLENCHRRAYQKYGYYCVDHASLSKGNIVNVN